MTFAGDTDRLSLLRDEIKDRIWPKLDSSGFYGIKGEGYPQAQHWDKEKEILKWMKKIGGRRKNADTKMARMALSIGVDASAMMIIRSEACPLSVPGLGALCPAINDDWDEFQSLKEVAAYTNPKMAGSLVALPRDEVNVVWIDHYSEAFTAEAKKLNKGPKSR